MQSKKFDNLMRAVFRNQNEVFRSVSKGFFMQPTMATSMKKLFIVLILCANYLNSGRVLAIYDTFQCPICSNPSLGEITCIATEPDLDGDGQVSSNDLVLFIEMSDAEADRVGDPTIIVTGDSDAVRTQKILTAAEALVRIANRPSDLVEEINGRTYPPGYDKSGAIYSFGSGDPLFIYSIITEEYSVSKRLNLTCNHAAAMVAPLLHCQLADLPVAMVYYPPSVPPEAVPPVGIVPISECPGTPYEPCVVPPAVLPMPAGPGPFYCAGVVDPTNFKNPCIAPITPTPLPPDFANPHEIICSSSLPCEVPAVNPVDPTEWDGPTLPSDMPCSGSFGGGCGIPSPHDLPSNGYQPYPLPVIDPQPICAGPCDPPRPFTAPDSRFAPGWDQTCLGFSCKVPKMPPTPAVPIPPATDPFDSYLMGGVEWSPPQSTERGSLAGEMPRTENSVDLLQGQKIEQETDLAISISGRDFTLVRHYGSSKWDRDGLPGLFGKGWSSPVFRQAYLDPSQSSNADLVILGEGPNSCLRMVWQSGESKWRPRAGTDLYAISTTDGGNNVWAVVKPGAGESVFYRDGTYAHRLKLERDEYGNTWNYEYHTFDGVVRLHRIYLNGTGENNCEAAVAFGYYLDPSAVEWDLGQYPDLNGRVARIVVVRFEGTPSRTPIETHRIEYTYKHNGDGFSPDTGSGGDLIQVVKYSRADETRTVSDLTINSDPSEDGLTGRVIGPNYRHTPSVVQYRYHSYGTSGFIPDLFNSTQNFESRDHLLKSIIRSRQIEYCAEQMYKNGPSNLKAKSYSVMDVAYRLMTLSDTCGVFIDTNGIHSVNGLFSKYVLYHFTHNYSPAGQLSVYRQYLLAACGCAGSGHGVREDFRYAVCLEGRSPYSGPPQRRSARIEKSELLLNGTWSKYSTQWVDSTQYGGSSGPFYCTTSVCQDESTGKQWATEYERDEQLNLVGINTAAANRGRTYSAATWEHPLGGDHLGIACSVGLSGSYCSGLRQYFVYDSNHRVTQSGVKDAAGNLYPVTQVVYGGSGQPNERPHLPKSVRYVVDGTANDEIIEFEYSFHTSVSGVENNAIKSITVEQESDESGENPPGNLGAFESVTVVDVKGNVTWTRSADKVVTQLEYAHPSGKLTMLKAPVDSSTATLPTELGVVPLSGVPPLTYEWQYDHLGRLRKRVVPGPTGPLQEEYCYTYAPVGRPGLTFTPDLNELTGARYQAVIKLPPRLPDGNSYGGPAQIAWFSADGGELAYRSFPLNPSATVGDYNFRNIRNLVNSTSGPELERHTLQYSLSGLQTSVKQWHDLTSSPARYYETLFEYDRRGRAYKTTMPGGITLRTERDMLGRIKQRWVGSSSGGSETLLDAFEYDGVAVCGGSPFAGIGNGLITKITQNTGEASDPDRVTDFSYDFRDRLTAVKNPLAPHGSYEYDNLGRVKRFAMHTGTTPQPVTTATGRIEYEELLYNNRGLPYRRLMAIDPAQSSPQFLAWNKWYDEVGRVLKASAPDSPSVKLEYDELGRVDRSYLTDASGDLFSGSGNLINVANDTVLSQTHYRYNPNFSALDTVKSTVRRHDGTVGDGPLNDANDGVRTYTGYVYDGIGRPIRTVDFGTNAAINTPSSTLNDVFVNGTDPSVTWPPASVPSWETSGWTQHIITATEYNSRGLVDAFVDPKGRRTRTLYDDMNRPFATIENAVGSALTIAWDSSLKRWKVTAGLDADQPDQNRVTSISHAYDSSYPGGTGRWVVRQAAHVRGGGASGSGAESSAQITEMVYGVTASTGNPLSSFVNNPDLLAAIHYPDETTGLPNRNADHTVRYAYNKLGEVRAVQDQNLTVHAYTRDKMGRVLQDTATVDPASGIDDRYDKVSYAYSDHHLSSAMIFDTSNPSQNVHSSSFDYNSLHQLTMLWQDTPLHGWFIGYGYVPEAFNPSTPGSGNTARLLFMQYPTYDFSPLTNVHYTYGVDDAHDELVDNAISRPSALKIADERFGPPASTTELDLVEYFYVGNRTASHVDFASADIQLDRTVDSAGNRRYGDPLSGGYDTQAQAAYPGWDRFGRVKRQAWVSGDLTTGPNSLPNIQETVAFAYGYDNAGNPLSQYDARRHANPKGWTYEYDELDRLVRANKGRLTGLNPDSTHTVFTREAGTQDWRLDTLGNWERFGIDWDLTNNPAPPALPGPNFDPATEVQQRTHNSANELIAATAPATPPSAITFSNAPLTRSENQTYDAAGNLVGISVSLSTTNVQRYQLVYDGWNRLVKIGRTASIPASTPGPYTYHTMSEYEYNALSQRVKKVWYKNPGISAEAERRLYVYDAAWRPIVEEIYEGTDPNNTETYFDWQRIAQQFYGLGGTGGYDDPIYRREDRATAGVEVEDDPETPEEEQSIAPIPVDGFFDISYYQMSDAQGSIVRLTGESAKEGQVHYDPYGRGMRRVAGDYDYDGDVDVVDLNIGFTNGYVAKTLPDSDMDGDGDVDVGDLFAGINAYLAKSYGPTDQLGVYYLDEATGVYKGADNPFGYCGYYFDKETAPIQLSSSSTRPGMLGAHNGGLYHVKHRVYNPLTGRWLQRDPAGFVDGPNLYQYVGGGPGRYIDPMGLAADDDINVWLDNHERRANGRREDGAYHVGSSPKHEAGQQLGRNARAAFEAVTDNLNPANVIEDVGGLLNMLLFDNRALGQMIDNIGYVINNWSSLPEEQRAYILAGVTTSMAMPGGPLKGVLGFGKLGKAARLADKLDELGDAGIIARKADEACEAAGDGVDLALRYKPDWTAAQRAEAAAKVKILNDSPTVVTQVQRAGTSASQRYRQADGTIPPGNDVDHIIDLQLGGDDNISNMWLLNNSVNRSLGSQIYWRIKGLPIGTRINNITIED